MPTLRQSPAGVVGLPEDTKEQGQRVDFRPDKFSIALETKGYRLAWKQAAYCPCAPVNEQTEQPDPNCSLCEGSGWLMFQPIGAATDPKLIGTLDGLQTQVTQNAAVIQGIMSGIAAHDTPYDQAMRRIEGMMNCTTRAENKLGYYDQLINLDATIVYSQTLDASGTVLDSARYPIVLVNLLRSATTVFAPVTHYNIVNGDISWVSGQEPVVDTKLAIHYLTYPHWRVVEHPHMIRHTLVKFKTKKPSAPLGNPTDLPVQAVCKLEFIV